jgi:hypothetical protein
MGCILIWIFSSEEHNTCRAGYCPFEHAFLGGAYERRMFVIDRLQ